MGFKSHQIILLEITCQIKGKNIKNDNFQLYTINII